MSTRPASIAALGIGEEALPRARALGWLPPEGPPEAVKETLLALRAGPEPAATMDRLLTVAEASADLADLVRRDAATGTTLAALVGASRQIAKDLAHHPEWVADLADPDAEPAPAGDRSALQRWVRRRLASIAALDLTGKTTMEEAALAVSDTADAAVSRALELAREVVADRTPVAASLPFAVIAMGKWGARELNYSSDLDVLFVYDAPAEEDPEEARSAANHVAAVLMRLLAEAPDDGIIWRVDADLRPEGAAGPLARTLDAFRSYYGRWADTWELQALLKARPAVGDPDLGARFMAVVEPLMWPEALDPEAVRAIRHMKSRIERLAGDGEVKRGAGGIRDVEFAVQLLQLVHGRFDRALRVRSTLGALDALDRLGYVRHEDAATFAASYRWLRNLEHRLQLRDLAQTHRLPDGNDEREAVAKAMGYRDRPGVEALAAFSRDLAAHRAKVRTIHERLFYRPLLEALAVSPAVRLSPEEAARRLEVLGFRDVAAATRAFTELTAGLSRRSGLMAQMLPVMMEWLSDAPDPDLGLAQLRMLMASVPDNAQLVGTLRDRPLAAERLCRLLGTSRLLGGYIDRIPEFLPRLADEQTIADIPSGPGLVAGLLDELGVREGVEARLGSLRRFVRRRTLRIAARDLLDLAGPFETGEALSDSADAAVEAGLWVARHVTAEGRPLARDLPFAVVAMGRWGGRELTYASDLDVLFVYGGDGDAEREAAQRLAAELMAVLGRSTVDGVAYQVDAGLRPEGAQGPLTRSVDSYEAYYRSWGETWELQALTKARPVAGDEEVGRRFLAVVEPLVWPRSPSGDRLREIRQMKARVERERIPSGEDPDFHLKLGPGGLTDVEFLAQLLQIRLGGERPELRRTGTVAALDALGEAGALARSEVRVLVDAYRFHTRVRNRMFLQAGRPLDSLPADPDEGTRLARSLGYRSRSELREEYRRMARRTRRIFEDRFFAD